MESNQTEKIGGLQEYFHLKSQFKKISPPPQNKDYIHIHSQFLALLKSKPSDDLRIKPQPFDRQQLLQLLHSNNNLCFYGLGSKITFLQQLAQFAFPHLPIFVINGYLPQVTQRNVINQMVEWVNRIGEGGEKIQRPIGPESMRILRGAIEKLKGFEVVLVFHNLDGPNLMAPEVQLNLSQLGKCRNIRLIASVDNPYIAMRWAPNTINNFGFLFHHIITGVTYVQQLKFRFRSDQKHDRQQQSLRYIWRSLTPNQKEILKIIAKRQLANLSGQPEVNYTFSELLDQCINQTVLGNDSQLRENLFEILDHKVVEETTSKGKKAYTMNYDRKILENIYNGVYES